eukprot:SAG11_NODE_3181_length_2626_cov_2.488326_1_plen_57_part_00
MSRHVPRAEPCSRSIPSDCSGAATAAAAHAGRIGAAPDAEKNSQQEHVLPVLEPGR